jgi:hypothetical protein
MLCGNAFVSNPVKTGRKISVLLTLPYTLIIGFMNQNKTSQVDFDSTGFSALSLQWRKVLILSLLIADWGQ